MICITRKPYVRESSSNSPTVSAGSAVDAVVKAIHTGISKTYVTDMLKAAAVSVVKGNIQKAVYPPRTQKFSFYYGIEGYIYDTTRENAYVEIFEEWSKCWTELGFNNDGELDYQLKSYPNSYPIPHWESNLCAVAFPKAQRVLEIYNNNLKVYKVWKHGKGNGIGY
ncbi:MAG: hypothetical protein Q4F05_10240 [bacterium]|nr:hypothetical protein [bacterium]